MRNRIAFSVALVAAVLAAPAVAGDAKGTVGYKGRTAEVKFAYLVRPDGRHLSANVRDDGFSCQMELY